MEVFVLPLVRQDGSYVIGPQGEEVFQVIGGPHDGKRGSWQELAQLTGELVLAEEGRAVSAETGAILEEVELRITVGAEEHIRLATLAARRGVTAEELIEAFVADLTGSLRGNGYEARGQAEQWLNQVEWTE